MTQANATDRQAPIYQIVAAIPPGKVASYGQVAALAGMHGAARYVGYCLRNLPGGSALPWHRVVTAAGHIAFAADTDACQRQMAKLQAEGIELLGTRVDMKRYQWRD
jgi:methylated-DNA-protein-cysteine methyltransferase related protein